jgi:Domain of unknown function (DUF3883)
LLPQRLISKQPKRALPTSPTARPKSETTSNAKQDIEVKTTAFGKETPFFITRGEVAFAKEHDDQFQLYRLFDFRREPRMFTLHPDSGHNLALFQEASIHRTWHKNQWWFTLIDVVVALTDSRDPTQYISKIRLRDKDLAQGWVQFVHPLRIQTEGGA